ncbi:ABC transporter permease [Burkholderia aenigmatica]|uniref:Sugar ABC transporter permease n=1 Tax=Burkholderia aenigmatica TaxID=2015348 RepID=A0A228IZS6_9BURK|nr:ABC transporter permease [Burkholderia aenigmatica]OXI48073.1 sugar ABC transporter permease [Burkholderia aenigmatica]
MQTRSATSLYRSLEIQARIIFALIMREIITRYGRHNIGFAWLFAEPMLFTSGIVVLWSLLHEGSGHQEINIIAYAITGYSTVLVWRNTIGRCSLAIEPNMSLLVHRNVRPIDFFLSRIILELAGTSLSAIAMIGIFVATELIPPPADILIMLKGWLLLCWYSAAMGLLIGGLTEFSDLVEKLWHPIAYFQLPVSGAFALASWLPPGLRHIVLLFPVPNAVEIFRYGYFGNTIRPYYDTPYVCSICLILTWLGLLAAQSASRRLDAK